LIVEDEYLLELFERAAGDPPSAPDALEVLRPRIRRARRRRTAFRGGAGLVALVVLGSVLSSTTTRPSRDVRVGGSATTAVVDSTPTTVSAPTSIAVAGALVPGGAPEPSPTTTVARSGPGGGGGEGGDAVHLQPPPAAPQTQTASKAVVSKGAGPGHPSGPSSTSTVTSIVYSQSGGAPQVTSFDAQGGTVEVKYTDSSMSLGEVSPSPGWSIAATQSNGDTIEVTFAQDSGGDPVAVDVHLDAGKPTTDDSDSPSVDASVSIGG
jgi:hypothetical protein